MTGTSPLRWLFVAAAVLIAWTLLVNYAGTILLLCSAVALWRLWCTASANGVSVSRPAVR